MGSRSSQIFSKVKKVAAPAGLYMTGVLGVVWLSCQILAPWVDAAFSPLRPSHTTVSETKILSEQDQIQAKHVVKEAQSDIERMKNEVRGWGDLLRTDVEQTRGYVRAQRQASRAEMIDKSEMVKEIKALKERVEALEKE